MARLCCTFFIEAPDLAYFKASFVRALWVSISFLISSFFRSIFAIFLWLSASFSSSSLSAGYSSNSSLSIGFVFFFGFKWWSISFYTGSVWGGWLAVDGDEEVSELCYCWTSASASSWAAYVGSSVDCATNALEGGGAPSYWFFFCIKSIALICSGVKCIA